MISTSTDKARWEIILTAENKINCQAFGDVDDKANFMACCTLLFGAVQQSEQPEKLFDEVVKQVRAKLGIEEPKICDHQPGEIW
jgi:hypothetical protein